MHSFLGFLGFFKRETTLTIVYKHREKMEELHISCILLIQKCFISYFSRNQK